MTAQVEKIIVITHEDRADTRLVEEFAAARGLDIHVVRPYRGDELPPLDDSAALICLGGPMAAYDDLPFIVDEKAHLMQAVRSDRPVLGICLGSQLLADALGGTVMRGHLGPECGYIDVRRADDGDSDFDGTITGRFFSFHGDTMQPPEEATVLARSDRYVQAWTLGTALAVQFHPELSLEGLTEFFNIEADKIAAIGMDIDQSLREHERAQREGITTFFTMLDQWLAHSRKRALCHN